MGDVDLKHVVSDLRKEVDKLQQEKKMLAETVVQLQNEIFTLRIARNP